jgi:hypothetical protein
MGMMLKSFGIDPEKIKAEFKQTFENVTASVMAEVNAIKETQARIEKKLDMVLEIRGSFDSMNVVESEPERVQHGGYINGSGKHD